MKALSKYDDIDDPSYGEVREWNLLKKIERGRPEEEVIWVRLP